MSKIARTASLLAMLGLAACGGGGSGGGGGNAGSAANTPPASAAASTQGFVSYLQQLVASTSETADAVDLSGFAAPSSDTDEAAPI